MPYAHPPSEDDIQLPDRRKVNAEMRRERELEKAKEKMVNRGDGLFREPLEEARRRHAGDPLRQIAYLYSVRTIPAAKGRVRFIGNKRYKDLRKHLEMFVAMLPNLRCPIQNLSELGIKHVVPLVRAWQETGLSAGTIQGYLSVLRRFFCLVGKGKVLPKGTKMQDLLASKGLQLEGRGYIPDLEKGWRDLGHDVLEIIEHVRQSGHEVIACQLEMMHAWGLRDAESFGIRPHESERETNGAGLAITRNTKGGKHRTAYYFKNNPQFAQYQREVLERAKAASDKHPDKLLSIPGLTLEQMTNRFNWIMRKFRITKNGRGITPHGLRHQFACDLFYDVCGLPAPVLGLVDAAVYRQKASLVDKALLEVSLQLGHERKTIAYAYTGSPDKLGKTQRKRIEASLDRLSLAADAFKAADVQEAWMVDTCGRGGLLRPGELMRLAVRLDENLSLKAATERLDILQAQIEQVTSLALRVDAWQRCGAPDDATQILFDADPDEQPQLLAA